MNNLMLQGATSNCGKSIVARALCGLLSKKGYKVATFQPDVRFDEHGIRMMITQLQCEHDCIILEGIGNPVEWSLTNMKMANMANAPVILIGDIERGGVFAGLYGTYALLKEQHRISGFLINKFRGDREILSSGLRFLEERTGKPVVGVIPYSARDEFVKIFKESVDWGVISEILGVNL
ncbi:MAG: AAA family ATPase [Methanocellales archaeon]|nr:AAA family ATPase [Methanocellales archaeon]